MPALTNGPRLIRHLLSRAVVLGAWVCGWLFLFGSVAPSIADDDGVEHYLKAVKPLLMEKCWACHGVLKQQANLRLDTAAFAIRGGDSGPAIQPGNLDSSLLWKVVTGADGLRMPPEADGSPLTADDLAIVRKWIASGASAPGNEAPQTDPREFWSYRPIVKPAVPQVEESERFPIRGPIDAWIAAEHAAKGLTPNPPAPKHVWLRRVHLDLTGLPPTVAEVDAFLADENSDAYERVVDDLLARPSYGQRWGRHWMDIWRYSDWYGSRGINEVRYSMRAIWRWRDWIVDRMNVDPGYDQMVQHMIAGDELAPTDPQAWAATGYLGRNWYKFDRNVWMFDAVEKTSEALLAATTRCCRCHDHKYDPIEQAEYYSLRAIFEPHRTRTEPLTLDAKTEKDATLGMVLTDGVPRVFDQAEDAPTYLFERGDDRMPDKTKPMTPGVPKAFGGTLDVQPVTLPGEAWYPALRPNFRAGYVAQADAKVKAAEEMLVAANAALDAAQTKLVSFDPNSPPDNGAPWLVDSFDKLDAEKWTAVGNWSPTDGKLRGTAGARLTTKLDHPRNFRLKAKYKTFEAGPFRSIGFSFDEWKPGDCQDVYTSVNPNQPSVQAFHHVGGKDVYPAQGIHPLPLRLNETITLEFEVRGVLLTVSVDGQKRFDYLLPLARRSGKLAFWIFDGEGELDEIEITEPSPTQASLAEAAAEAKHQVELATLARDVALAERASLDARLTADAARYGGSPEEQSKPLVQIAAKAEKTVAITAGRAEGISWRRHLAALQEAASALPTDNPSLTYAIPETEKRVAEAQATETTAIAAAETPSEDYPAVGERHPSTSTGRRAAFARWLTDRQNPRTARVAVNHLWLRHFGEGFCATPNNFGLNGDRPVMLGLFDWLAAELIDSGWQMKPLHRQIVLSSVYRQSSAEAPAESPNTTLDPKNRLLWRMPPRRMEAEVVRDSVLYLGRSLDATFGGPEIPEGQGQTTPRRSLYFRNTPNEKVTMLEVFDVADPNACFRRKENVVPQQALALMNSGLAQDQARRIARRLAGANPGDPLVDDADARREFVRAAFWETLARPASPAEIERCVSFLTNETPVDAPQSVFAAGGESAIPPAPPGPLRRREQLIHVLLCHAEFVTIR